MRRRADERVRRAVHLAMTRATDELWLPGDALSMLSARVLRDRQFERNRFAFC